MWKDLKQEAITKLLEAGKKPTPGRIRLVAKRLYLNSKRNRLPCQIYTDQGYSSLTPEISLEINQILSLYNAPQVQAIYDYFVSGCSLREISTMYGKSATYWYNFFKKVQKNKQ